MKDNNLSFLLIFLKNNVLKFIPLLLLYSLIIILFSSNQLTHDEPRYYGFASNLLKGYYSLPYPEIALSNGPGYPLVLALFLKFNLPLIVPRLFNGLLLFFSVILVYKSLIHFIVPAKSIKYAYFLGLYFPTFRLLPLLITEALTIFLIAAFIFTLIRAVARRRYAFFWPGLIFGYLALTKLIFGYILLLVLALSIVYYIVKKQKFIHSFLLVFFTAFLVCVPYLFYTYSLTGKILYWGSGNSNLYFMTSPHSGEYGEWFSDRLTDKSEWIKLGYSEADHTVFMNNHGELLENVKKVTELEKDELYWKASIENIKNYPQKFFKNCLANTGRMLFSYPFSYQEKMKLGTFVTMIPNMFIVVIALFLIFPTIYKYKSFPSELVILFFIFLLYFCASIPLSANYRQFIILTPMLTIWFAYMIEIQIKLEIRNN